MLEQLKLEETRFARTLRQGEREFEKVAARVTDGMIDGLTAFTDYQGFFLLPNQHFALDKGGFLPTKWDFRRINLVGTELSAYLLWCPDNHGFPIEVSDVWVKPASKKNGV